MVPYARAVAVLVVLLVAVTAVVPANAQQTEGADIPSTPTDRLADCLSRNLPLPEPGSYITWPANAGALRAKYRGTLEGELFVKGMLTSAGMYGNQPMDVRDAFATAVAPGILAYQAGTGSQALGRLSDALEQAHDVSHADLGSHCGLTLIRRVLRDQPATAGVFLYFGAY